MNLKHIREMVGSILDYDPNIVSYKNEVNRVINECYREFINLHPWPFSQATVDDYALPDISATGLSTTALTAGDKSISITGIGDNYLGCVVQISGAIDDEDNGEFYITKISGLTCYLEKLVAGRKQPQHHTQWFGWKSSNAGTITAKVMQRYLPLPIDCDYPVACNIRNPIEAGKAGYKSLYQLTRRRDEELNLKIDLSGSPTDWIAYDTAPDKIWEARDFPAYAADFVVSEAGVASNFWPQGEYQFKFCYVFNGVCGPLSDPIDFVVSLANAGLTFTTRDTTLNKMYGLRKRFFVRLKSVGGYSDELFRDVSAYYTGVGNTGSTGAKFVEIEDSDVSYDWPRLTIDPSNMGWWRSLPRAPENEGRCWRVRLFPRPAGTTGNDLGLPIRLRYVQQPQRLTIDDDTPLSPPDTHRYLVYRACEELFQKFNNIPQAEFYRRKADRELLKCETKHLQTKQGPNIKAGYRNGPVWTKPFVTLTHT